MNAEIKQKLQDIFEKIKSDNICVEKPSFASIVFAYRAIKPEMIHILDTYKVSVENYEWFLTESAPISRLTFSLRNLGIIEDNDECYPFWINYIGDLCAEEIIQEAKEEIEWMKNHPITK